MMVPIESALEGSLEGSRGGRRLVPATCRARITRTALHHYQGRNSDNSLGPQPHRELSPSGESPPQTTRADNSLRPPATPRARPDRRRAHPRRRGSTGHHSPPDLTTRTLAGWGMHFGVARARVREHSPARVDSPGAWVDSRDRAGSGPCRTLDRAGGPSSRRVNPRLDGRSPAPARAHPRRRGSTGHHDSRGLGDAPRRYQSASR